MSCGCMQATRTLTMRLRPPESRDGVYAFAIMVPDVEIGNAAPAAPKF